MTFIKTEYSFIYIHFWKKGTVNYFRTFFFSNHYRCVPESQGSFALGINQLIIRIFAFIPAPIVFGYIIDAACRLHQEDPCDSQAERNCLEYDADLFRLVCVCVVSALLMRW